MLANATRIYINLKGITICLKFKAPHRFSENFIAPTSKNTIFVKDHVSI